MTYYQQLIRVTGQRLHTTWRTFLATHILASLAGYTVLLPMLTGLFQLSLSLTGHGALSDEEILLFALSPAGLSVLLLVGSVGLLVLVWSHSAMMVIAYSAEHQRPTTALSALIFVVRRCRTLLRLSLRIILRILLIVVPYLLVLFVIYTQLLSAYDINFYLSTKPWQFWVSAGLALAATVLLIGLLVATLISWFYALQLVLFSGTAPTTALTLSAKTSRTWRRRLVYGLLSWALVALCLFAAVPFATNMLGQQLIPPLLGDMQKLVIVLGLLLLFSVLITALAQALSGAVLAVIMIRLYRDAGLDTCSAATFQLLSASRPKKSVKPRLAIALIVVVSGLSIWLSKALLDSLATDDNTAIIAHRGASGTAPENTLAAIRMALNEGADWVEIDVQETADDAVVVIHDSDLKKVAGVDLKIWDATLAELADIDIGSWFSPGFSDQRVPTLREVLELCRGRAGVIIELKYYGHNIALEERVATIVEQTQMVDNVLIMSLDNAGLTRMKQLRPNWPTGLLTSVAAGQLDHLNLDFYAVNARMARRHFIKGARASGRQVMVWTVNDAVSMSMMMSRGVDGVITDYPALGQDVLRQRAELSPPERMLIELAAWFGHEANYLTQ